jgi:hypothetical protein
VYAKVLATGSSSSPRWGSRPKSAVGGEFSRRRRTLQAEICEPEPEHGPWRRRMRPQLREYMWSASVTSVVPTTLWRARSASQFGPDNRAVARRRYQHGVSRIGSGHRCLPSLGTDAHTGVNVAPCSRARATAAASRAYVGFICLQVRVTWPSRVSHRVSRQRCPEGRSPSSSPTLRAAPALGCETRRRWERPWPAMMY